MHLRDGVFLEKAEAVSRCFRFQNLAITTLLLSCAILTITAAGCQPREKDFNPTDFGLASAQSEKTRSADAARKGKELAEILIRHAKAQTQREMVQVNAARAEKIAKAQEDLRDQTDHKSNSSSGERLVESDKAFPNK